MSEKKKVRELAFEDFFEGMKYKDIAEKYDISINTVKSWRRRYWGEMLDDKSIKNVSEKVAKNKKNRKKPLRNRVSDDLFEQLRANGVTHAHFIDLAEDYMSLWDTKNKLIADIEERGVSVIGANGFLKKNDSINELNKTNTQMLKILNELNLKAVIEEEDEGEADV